MASLSITSPSGTVRQVPLHKRLTRLGHDAGNDIQLPDASAPASGPNILFDGKTHVISSADGRGVLINGKQRAQHTFTDGDILVLGDTELRYSHAESPSALPAPAPLGLRPDADAATIDLPGHSSRELAFLRRLVAFSDKVLAVYDVDRLLELWMDEAVAVTRADKGFLILLENGEPRVKVARNIGRENIENAIDRFSDSIVQRVVRTGCPVLIADALEDPELKASESVVNLKVLSVMCVPLRIKGELFGLIYVGNDRLVNRFEQKSLDMLTVFAAQASLILQNAMLVNELRLDNTALRRQVEAQRFGDLFAASTAMKDVFRRIDKVAGTDISVLITGDTGTGKELIARELHRRSARVSGPFITINCGAIPDNLLESELFGHVKGAFTGAIATKGGRFQAAIGGTLFLDEIGEMPLPLQVKLLRALQEKVVYKVGETRGDAVDIRVVAATNKNLEAEIRNGTFREDLYYRINTVTVKLPALRERGDDVVVLAKLFLQKYAHEFGSRARGFTPAATVAMRKYGWPGNVRELENRIKKAVVLAEQPLLGAEDLELHLDALDPILPLAQAKEEFQKRYINEVLDRNNGNRTKTAKDLGVDPRTIFRHLEKLAPDNPEG